MYVYIVTSMSSPVLQVACYGVTINRTQQGRENICLVGLKWWGYVGVGAAAAQSQIFLSPALCHTSICSSLSLFLPGSVLHSARIKIVSSICHIPGSSPAVSNDPVSPCSVTLRWYSVHPQARHPLSHLTFCLSHLLSSHPHALSSFSYHPHTLIQYSYLRGHLWAWNRACASAPFSVREKPTFSPRAFPCPPPLPYLANPDSGFGFVLLIFF